MKAVFMPKIANEKRTPLQDVIPLPYPFAVQLDVADACNMRCNFCFHSDTDSIKRNAVKLGIMNYDLYTKIIDDIKEKWGGGKQATEKASVICAR